MPIPLGPMKFSCAKCGWSRVINMQSDVIFGPHSCPRCGGLVEMSRAGLMDRMLSLDGSIPFLRWPK